MASLLDIFGGDDEALRGLLGSQYQPTREQAQAQALFGLANGLYAAGAPSRTPSAGIGQGIAQGIEAGQQAYRQALQTSLADKLQAEKIQDMLNQRQEQMRVQEILRNAPMRQMADTYQGQRGPLTANQMPSQIDFNALVPQLATSEIGLKKLSELKAAQEMLAPKTQVVDGVLYEQRDGQWIPVTSREEKLTYQDLGNAVAVLNSKGQRVGTLPKGLAPQAAPSMQALQTESGFVGFNPKTGAVTPITVGGQPLMGAGAKQTEDQAKATGWLIQARNAYSNMQNALAEDKAAANPSYVEGIPLVGSAMASIGASAAQQKFRQGASSLSEALLRAATGAGINESEARQKIAELTPQPFDTQAKIDQKLAAIPAYLQGLEIRAGKQGVAAAEKIVPMAETPSAQMTKKGKWKSVLEQYGLEER